MSELTAVSNKAKPVGIGAAPSHLNDFEREIWDEMVSNFSCGSMQASDRISLEVICRLTAQSRLDFDEMPAAKLGQLSSLLGRFGMTPVDRNKVVTKKEDKKNAFASL